VCEVELEVVGIVDDGRSGHIGTSDLGSGIGWDDASGIRKSEQAKHGGEGSE
jgi:hypothetical protein